MASIKNDRPLTLSRLKELLDYDPDIGLFVWLIHRKAARAGSIAGTVRKDGYRFIKVDGVNYSSWRLAWFYSYGCWPAGYLDHINGVRCDDRLANLREATVAENAANAIGRSKSGVKGVYPASKRNAYNATIMWQGKSIYLGYFRTVAEAAAARRKTALRLYGGFAFEARSKPEECPNG